MSLKHFKDNDLIYVIYSRYPKLKRFKMIFKGQNHTDPSRCECSTYLICGNTKPKNKTEEDFKIWKESKLERVIHHVEYPTNGTTILNDSESKENHNKGNEPIPDISENKVHNPSNLKDDKIVKSSKNVPESVIKEIERNVQAENKPDHERSSSLALSDSYKDVRGHSAKYADRHAEHEDEDNSNVILEGYSYNPKVKNIDVQNEEGDRIKEDLTRYIGRHMNTENETNKDQESWYSSPSNTEKDRKSDEHDGDDKGNI